MSKRTYPVAELHTLTDDIEGIVKFSRWFKTSDWVTKADLLKDWIHDLEKEYDAVISDPDKYKTLKKTK